MVRRPPRFRDNPSRVANKALIEGLVAAVLATEDRARWFETLDAAGNSCSPVNTVPQALGHPQTEALAIKRTDPARPEVAALDLPLSFDGVRPALETGAPDLDGAGRARWRDDQSSG